MKSKTPTKRRPRATEAEDGTLTDRAYRELADTLLVMASGRVVASGPTAEVLARADVRATLTGAPA